MGLSKANKTRESALKKDTVKIDAKAIKEVIKSRLESQYPHFDQLKRKRKREIIKELSDAAMKVGELDIPVMSQEERVGLGPVSRSFGAEILQGHGESGTQTGTGILQSVACPQGDVRALGPLRISLGAHL